MRLQKLLTNFCRDSLFELGGNEKNCTPFDRINMQILVNVCVKCNNIYSKLKPSTNNSTEVVPHDVAQRASHVLSVDNEVVPWNCSLISAFSRPNSVAKGFLNFVGIQYSSVLLHSKGHWLSLTNIVEISSLFEAPKLNFNSIEEAPKILVDFLNNPLSGFYLFLVHRLQYLFSNRIIKIERRANRVTEVLYYLNLWNVLKRELMKNLSLCKC